MKEENETAKTHQVSKILHELDADQNFSVCETDLKGKVSDFLSR